MNACELVKQLRETFESHGFSDDFSPYHNNSDYQTSLTKDNKASYINGRFYGYELYIHQVCRHNGAAENTSVDVTIHKYNKSIGVNIANNEKQRFNTKMGAKAIEKRVNAILETWERVTNE